MLNSKKETKTIGTVTMTKEYTEWFNNRSGDVNCKTLIRFKVNGYVVASASKYNDNKLMPFGDDAEKYLKLFQVVA